jgi:hypothetical protein
MLDKRSLAHAPRTLDNYILTILGEFLELTLKFWPRAKVFPGNDASIFKRVHARNYTKNALRKSSLKIAHSCAAQNPALHLLFRDTPQISPQLQPRRMCRGSARQYSRRAAKVRRRLS